MLHIAIGIIGAILVWKLIKITFKSLLWFILAGIIAFLIFPKALAVVGGIGFLVIGFLITLIVLAFGGTPACIFCNSAEGLVYFKNKGICKNCLDESKNAQQQVKDA